MSVNALASSPEKNICVQNTINFLSFSCSVCPAANSRITRGTREPYRIANPDDFFLRDQLRKINFAFNRTACFFHLSTKRFGDKF